MEQLIIRLFRECANVEVAAPFQRLSYADAVGFYGSDKPDLRFGLTLVDVSDIVASSGVKVFANIVAGGGVVKAINAKGCSDWSRKELDDLTPFAARYGGKGLAYIVIKDGEWKGPIVKFLSAEEIHSLTERLGAQEGDVLLFSADKAKIVHDVLGNLRLKLGKELGLIDESTFKFAWVVDFPLLGWDEEDQRWVAEHHPFTRPREEDVALFDTNPGAIRAQAYDLVLNGYEVGGGSMRIYKRNIQEKMFEVLGLTMEEAYDKFGFLLDAFDYGTPPHGGVAFGFDRLVMLIAGRNNLRETIAFPKTASASDLLSGAPSPVEDKQLQQLSIRVSLPQKQA
jgi:aspartyl-tRNA synthetase